MVLLGVGQAADRILDDHHRAIDDDAEVQRAEAHQVGADLVAEHAGEGKQHRQRNDHRGDQRGADVAEEQEQNHDHQDRAFDQVLLHRGNGFIDQIGAVIDRHRADPGRQ
ncbi:hypothetical protein D9M71_273970 [compost metagenome]